MNERPVCFAGMVFLCGFVLLCEAGIKPVPSSESVGARGIQSVRNAQGDQVCLYKESHALLIGVSDYTAGWADLNGVKKDIPRVKAALSRQGFDVVTVMDPTKRELESALASFISKYGRHEDNRLLIYYSGHGYTLRKKWGDDMGYIVPVDAPDPNVDRDGFADKAINMVKVEGWAKDIDSKHALFMFDSCFSGALFSLSKAAPAIINYKTSRPVRQFITAGSEAETVPDKSIFCQQFLDALGGEGDGNGDGYLTGSELGEYLQSSVVNYSYDSQHPQYGKIRDRRLDKGDFVFCLPRRANTEENLQDEVDGSTLLIRSRHLGVKLHQRNRPKEIRPVTGFSFISDLKPEPFTILVPSPSSNCVIKIAARMQDGLYNGTRLMKGMTTEYDRSRPKSEIAWDFMTGTGYIIGPHWNEVLLATPEGSPGHNLIGGRRRDIGEDGYDRIRVQSLEEPKKDKDLLPEATQLHVHILIDKNGDNILDVGEFETFHLTFDRK